MQSLIQASLCHECAHFKLASELVLYREDSSAGLALDKKTQLNCENAALPTCSEPSAMFNTLYMVAEIHHIDHSF